ncbi:MAG: DnaD domain protein [Oscillospiraceae bacterium]|nr:DnaD domain protein [Oscillospiraceae bacterium]
MFCVNYEAFGGVFALPVSLSDNYLLLSSGELLKVIIFAFRNADKQFSAEDVAKATGLNAADAADALIFWEKEGFIKNRDKKPAEILPEKTAAEAQEKKPEKELFKVSPTRLSHEIICSRLSEDKNVRELFNEAQGKLGRTLGDADMSSLLNLYDYYGLPAEVIMSICEYARIHKKERNMGYIYKLGIDWSTRGIDTLESAGEELMRLESINENWVRFAEITGIKTKIPTAAQQKYLDKWISDWKFTFEMLSLAFDEAAKYPDKKSFPYIDGILKKWNASGIDTPEKVKENEIKFREEQVERAAKREPANKNKTLPDTQASYDINRAVEKMNTSVPTLKKKEKR